MESMRKEAVISMVYIMAMAGAMCWVIAHDRPDKALCIILLLHICVVLIMTLRWLGKMMNVHKGS